MVKDGRRKQLRKRNNERQYIRKSTEEEGKNPKPTKVDTKTRLKNVKQKSDEAAGKAVEIVRQKVNKGSMESGSSSENEEDLESTMGDEEAADVLEKAFLQFLEDENDPVDEDNIDNKSQSDKDVMKKNVRPMVPKKLFTQYSDDLAESILKQAVHESDWLWKNDAKRRQDTEKRAIHKVVEESETEEEFATLLSQNDFEGRVAKGILIF